MTRADRSIQEDKAMERKPSISRLEYTAKSTLWSSTPSIFRLYPRDKVLEQWCHFRYT